MLIKNCKILLDNHEQIVDILIKDGKISEIKKDIDVNDNETIDANFHYVLPGIIDAHCHMREPGLTHKEDLLSGSKACARGGVTTFIDMPNTIPPTFTLEDLEYKTKLAQNNLYVDYGFHLGTDGNNIEEIIKTKDKVCSVKLFLNSTTGNLLLENQDIISNIFKNAKIISTHAEEDKIDSAIAFSKKFNTPLYVCHVSNEYELNAIKKAKEENINIYAELTPHHLFFSQESINEDNKKLLLMKPLLKSKHDNDVLINALNSNVIDTIGTDHAPHLYQEKLEKDTYGIPSVEHSLELMWKFVDNKKITVKRLIELMCENPSKIFKIKNKGYIKNGYDGDLVIIDENDKSIIKQEDIVTKANWSPYIGFSRGCKVLMTIVRGNLVYDNGKYFPQKGKGVTYE